MLVICKLFVQRSITLESDFYIKVGVGVTILCFRVPLREPSIFEVFNWFVGEASFLKGSLAKRVHDMPSTQA